MKRSFASGRSSVRCRSEMKSVRTTLRRYFWPPTSVIDSMTTGWRGTSLGNGPPAPVGVLAILVTTSMPRTTLPNTA